MRPRRVILLVDADEDRLGRWRFVLDIAGFRVFGVSSEAAARKVLKARAYFDPEKPRLDLLVSTPRFAKLSGKHLPRLELGTQTAMVLIDQIRTLAARQRGPRTAAGKDSKRMLAARAAAASAVAKREVA